MNASHEAIWRQLSRENHPRFYQPNTIAVAVSDDYTIRHELNYGIEVCICFFGKTNREGTAEVIGRSIDRDGAKRICETHHSEVA